MLSLDFDSIRRMAKAPESTESAGAIGARIVQLREAMGLKQAAFARLLEITPQQLSNVESGANRPSWDLALTIVKKTGATFDWIARGELGAMPMGLVEKLQRGSAIPQRKKA